MTSFRAHIVNAENNENIRTEDFELDTLKIDNKEYERVLDADDAERQRAQELLYTATRHASKELAEGEKIDQVTVIRGY